MCYLEIGDVFTCDIFDSANWKVDYETGELSNRLEIVEPYEHVHRTYTHHWTEKKEGGWTREREKTIDITADDETRHRAEFVVILQRFHPGEPNACGYLCKRLNNDGTYNENGEEIEIIDSSSYHGYVEPKYIHKTRKMKRIFV